MKLTTTVRVEVEDARGEKFVVERRAVSLNTDNTRFAAAEADAELYAIGETVLTHLVSQYGGGNQLRERRAKEGR